jgi:hypothetical protein
MCQWGAYEYSKLGWTYLQILDHYYRLYWYYDYGDGDRVGEEPPPPPPPPVPIGEYDTDVFDFIDSVGMVFFHVAGRVGLIADSCYSLPIVGHVLSSLFSVVSEKFDDAWLIIHDLSYRGHNVHRFVQDSLHTTLVKDILSNLWPGLLTLVDRGKDWVEEQITALFPDWHEFMLAPASFILSRLIETWPWGPSFIEDPLGWLRGLLSLEFPELWYFIQDPKSFILGHIREWNEDAYKILVDPIGVIREHLRYILNVPESFFEDPWGYMIWRFCIVIKERIGLYRDHFKAIAEVMLKGLLDG